LKLRIKKDINIATTATPIMGSSRIQHSLTNLTKFGSNTGKILLKPYSALKPGVKTEQASAQGSAERKPSSKLKAPLRRTPN